MTVLGNALLELRWQVEPHQEDEFNRWYDEEHLADLCSIPGVLAGRRYVRVAVPYASPTKYNYFTAYSQRDLAVFDSAAYKEMALTPSEWTKRVAFELPMAREVGELLHGTIDHYAAGLVHVLTAVDASALDAFTEWYDDEHLPLLAAVEGVTGARRYRLTAPSSDGYEFAAFYDLADVSVATSDAWFAAGAATARRHAIGDRLRSHLQVYRAVGAIVNE